jgi:SAM domain (Sterile alpha motif)
MDVGDWLRSLGLGRYEALFHASEIDADVLPELTEVDLGVPIGHRKRLLRAISGLTAAESLAAPSVPARSRFSVSPIIAGGPWTAASWRRAFSLRVGRSLCVSASRWHLGRHIAQRFSILRWVG